MIFITWSGFGILVPVVAVLAFFGTAQTLQFINADFANFAAAWASAASLWFLGTFLKKKGHRRHLYWMPMEVWGLIVGAITVFMTVAWISKLCQPSFEIDPISSTQQEQQQNPQLQYPQLQYPQLQHKYPQTRR